MRPAKSSHVPRPAASLLMLVLAGLAAAPPGAAARPQRRHPPHRVRERLPPLPSADAVDLGTLAPPTRLSTLEQTYGDASFARDRARRRDDALVGDRGEERPSANVLFPCEPRSAGAVAYRCDVAPGVPGYGLGYAYNPAYVTSPLSSGHEPQEQAPILPGVTGFFFAVNGLGAGHGD